MCGLQFGSQEVIREAAALGLRIFNELNATHNFATTIEYYKFCGKERFKFIL